MSDIPEHDARSDGKTLHPDVEAAYQYVERVVATADLPGPAWYGWALREGFLAGISYAQKNGVPCAQEGR